MPLWKKVMPCGSPIGSPTPARTPPVSELESPKFIRIGFFLDLEVSSELEQTSKDRHKTKKKHWRKEIV